MRCDGSLSVLHSAMRPQSLASLGGHGLTPKEMDDDCWTVGAASFLPELGELEWLRRGGENGRMVVVILW